MEEFTKTWVFVFYTLSLLNSTSACDFTSESGGPSHEEERSFLAQVVLWDAIGVLHGFTVPVNPHSNLAGKGPCPTPLYRLHSFPAARSSGRKVKRY